MSVDAVNSLIRSLFYGESQASLAGGPKSEYAYRLLHNYPGSFDRAAFLECAAADVLTAGAKSTYSVVPELDTLALDPAWVGPPAGKSKDWIFAGKKPSGVTYILTVDSTYTAPDGQQQVSKDQVHVTILGGVAYYYSGACG